MTKKKKAASVEPVSRRDFGVDVKAGPRPMELLGVQPGGRLVVWDADGMVQPMSRFDTDHPHGYYVIDHHGAAVTVHLSNYSDGFIHVQTMGWGVPDRRMSKVELEKLLLGQVIPDPVVQAKITQLLNQIEKNLSSGLDAPHLQRGRIGGSKQ